MGWLLDVLSEWSVRFARWNGGSFKKSRRDQRFDPSHILSRSMRSLFNRDLTPNHFMSAPL